MKISPEEKLSILLSAREHIRRDGVTGALGMALKKAGRIPRAGSVAQITEGIDLLFPDAWPPKLRQHLFDRRLGHSMYRMLVRDIKEECETVKMDDA
jgi:hypothetical protein